MPTRKRQDRIVKILDTLHVTRGATIRELAEALEVSEMTIRRDLDDLAAERKVKLVHAGAIPFSPGGRAAWSLADETASGAVEKRRIGEKAGSLIEAGDVVIIDSGTTAEWLARSIPPDIPVTILCFALNVLLEVGRDKARTVVLAGGALHGESLVFESPEGINLIRRYRAGKAFLTAGGVSTKLGVTCTDPTEAELKKAAVASSQTRILLADSRKFGTVKPSWYADLRDFDAVVTDSGIALEYVEALRELGIALHVV
jgi:DeoR family transcriptional regulator, deoxyribose operon repressor